VVGGGAVLRVGNRGMDDHGLSVVGATGGRSGSARRPPRGGSCASPDAGHLAPPLLAVRGHAERARGARDGRVPARGAPAAGGR